MSLKRVTDVLEAMGCADKYKDAFIEHKVGDSHVENWLGDKKLADEKLSAIVPESESRANFIKQFLVSSIDKENVNGQNMKIPRSEGIKLKPTASREEIISLATLEAIETFIVLISVAEQSFPTFGEYFLDETFFQKYSQSAERKIIQIFKNRCDLADLSQLDEAVAKLCRLIQAKKNNLVYMNLLRRIEAEKSLDLDIKAMVDKYTSEMRCRMTELEQQDVALTMEDLEKINETVLQNVLAEFDKKEPRSSVFQDAKEELIKEIREVYGTFVHVDTTAEVNGVEKDVPELSNLKNYDPRNLQIVLRKQKLTKAAATRDEAETIATYDLLMEVMEESFDTFSEDFLDKEILERFSNTSETTAIQISGWTNFSRLDQVRRLIESENENLQHPNLLRKIEARETLEMEVQEIVNRYKAEMSVTLKEAKLDQENIEKVHDSILQKHVRAFSMREPRSTLFKEARFALIRKIKAEFETFMAEMKGAEERMKMDGKSIVRNAVQSYREIMEDVSRNGPGSNFEMAHNVAKNVCLKTIDIALSDQSKEFVEFFVKEAESRIQLIYDSLRG